MVSLLTMRSASDDRTTRALIRDQALRLFADLGPDRVSLRRIAGEIGVSHGLVVHHFGSKEGLRAVVDAYVVDLFDDLLAELAGAPGERAGDPFAPQASESLVTALLERLPQDSPVPGYLKRLFLDGSEPGRALFQRLFVLTRGALEVMVQNGYADRGEDPDVRAAFLLVNDLAMLLLRDQVRAATGIDPLSADGARRWGREGMEIYSHGLRRDAEPGLGELGRT
jgi:AcrR family transcriptional regulator